MVPEFLFEVVKSFGTGCWLHNPVNVMNATQLRAQNVHVPKVKIQMEETSTTVVLRVFAEFLARSQAQV